AAHHGVNVAVEETGDDRTACQIDDLGLGTDERLRLLAERKDALAADGERLDSRPLRVEGHDIAAPENEVGGDHGCVSWRICCSIMQTLFVSDEARKRIDDQLLACEEEQDNSKAGGVDHGRVRDDLRLQHEIAEAARDAKEL